MQATSRKHSSICTPLVMFVHSSKSYLAFTGLYFAWQALLRALVFEFTIILHATSPVQGTLRQDNNDSSLTGLDDSWEVIRPSRGPMQLPQLAFEPLELPTTFNVSPLDSAASASHGAAFDAFNDLHEREKPFRLMELPAEIRLNIYAHHFGYKRMTLPVDPDLIMIERCLSYDRKMRSRQTRNLLCISRQVHKEAGDVLWDCTSFVIQVGVKYHRNLLYSGYGLFGQDKHSRAFLLDKMKHAILVLHPEVTDGNEYHVELQRRMTTFGAQLRSLELQFQWTHRHPDIDAKAENMFSFLAEHLDPEIVTRVSSITLVPGNRGTGERKHWAPARRTAGFQQLIGSVGA